MKKITKISFLFLLLFFTIGVKNVQAATNSVGVVYQSYVNSIGWMNQIVDGNYSGTIGKSLPTEALKINLTNPEANMKIKYQVHIKNIGWINWNSNGQIAGITGKSLHIEAIRITLENAPNYHVMYKGHVQNIGWMNWVKDGQISGTTGKGLRLESLQIKIVKNSSNNSSYINTIAPTINGQAYVAGLGWKTPGNYDTSVESIKLSINNPLKGIGIRYKVHIQNIGWTNWFYNGSQAGTPGSGLKIEAVKVELTGFTGGYGILYKTNVERYGWTTYSGNGSLSGTTGYSRGIQGLLIQIANSETFEKNYNPNAPNLNLKPPSKILNVPLISQNPELPTGCEITSVTMMLRYFGANVNKIQLAREMPYHSSNPNLGYVGNPFFPTGWTIYPPALINLVKKYTGSAINLTGASIDTLENQIVKNKPVVVWVKMHGFSVHAITLTGYDSNNLYYNDPWSFEKNKAINKTAFLSLWQTQAKRAISY